MKKDTIDANRADWENNWAGFPSLPSNALAISSPKVFETSPADSHPDPDTWRDGPI
jgi:hypothetical protein